VLVLSPTLPGAHAHAVVAPCEAEVCRHGGCHLRVPCCDERLGRVDPQGDLGHLSHQGARGGFDVLILADDGDVVEVRSDPHPRVLPLDLLQHVDRGQGEERRRERASLSDPAGRSEREHPVLVFHHEDALASVERSERRPEGRQRFIASQRRRDGLPAHLVERVRGVDGDHDRVSLQLLEFLPRFVHDVLAPAGGEPELDRFHGGPEGLEVALHRDPCRYLGDRLADGDGSHAA